MSFDIDPAQSLATGAEARFRLGPKAASDLVAGIDVGHVQLRATQPVQYVDRMLGIAQRHVAGVEQLVRRRLEASIDRAQVRGEFTVGRAEPGGVAGQDQILEDLAGLSS